MLRHYRVLGPPAAEALLLLAAENLSRYRDGSSLDEATERQRRVWDKQAPMYDRSMGLMEKLLFGDGRAWVCSQGSGDVLEVAVGTGRNLPFYPQGIRLTGIDVSKAMLAIARRRAAALGREVDFRLGDAQALPFSDATFDTVVCTFALCSIPDDRQAVAEMKQRLKAGIVERISARKGRSS